MTTNITFESVVQNAFSSFMADYGYHIVEADDSYVRLDSPSASVQVHFDRRRSYEVGIGFAELENGSIARRIPFNLGEVYREFGVPDVDKCSFFQSTEISAVRKFLESAEEMLGEFCKPILAGDRDAFAAVADRRAKEAAAYTQQVQIETVREQADEAWHAKRYQEFVDLLLKHRHALPESDKRKLDYAERRLAGC